MSDIRIASRYAKSLLELSQEKGSTEAVFSDMKLFNEVCESNKALVSMLRSPVVPGDKKKAVLDKAFYGFNALTSLFVSTVVRKSREAYLPLIAREFISQYNRLNNIVPATVVTAVELDANGYNNIKAELEKKTGKSIELKTVVDPSIIGGLVVRMEDSLYDASLANKLKKIKKELVLN